uniref:Uncharacterized protein n=1 Tax=Glossina austeni TaxID=7395 RepID=A0A1A9UF09_GLOAU
MSYNPTSPVGLFVVGFQHSIVALLVISLVAGSIRAKLTLGDEVFIFAASLKVLISKRAKIIVFFFLGYPSTLFAISFMCLQVPDIELTAAVSIKSLFVVRRVPTNSAYHRSSPTSAYIKSNEGVEGAREGKIKAHSTKNNTIRKNV